MTPRSRILLAAAVFVASAPVSAQKVVGRDAASNRSSALSMCGQEAGGEVFKKISALGRCLSQCPNPGGAAACAPDGTGLSRALARGGSSADLQACQAYLAKSPSEFSTSSVEPRDWGHGSCPGEYGFLANLLYERAKSDPAWFKPAVNVMRKGAVKGQAFQGILLGALQAPDADVRALALRLLKDNFANADPRVPVPLESLIPLMYDDAVDPSGKAPAHKVAAQAISAVLAELRGRYPNGDERTRQALRIYGPVIGGNDALNPLPAGVKAPEAEVRTFALLALEQIKTTASNSKETRLDILRQLMHAKCEQDPGTRKVAFTLYMSIVTSHYDDLRAPVPDPNGGKTTNETLIADRLRKQLFAAVGGSAGQQCIGPVPPS